MRPCRPARADFSLSLIPGHEGTTATLNNILGSHRRSNLDRGEAEAIVAEVDDATRPWRNVLARRGVEPGHIEEVAWSFQGFRAMYLAG